MNEIASNLSHNSINNRHWRNECCSIIPESNYFFHIRARSVEIIVDHIHKWRIPKVWMQYHSQQTVEIGGGSHFSNGGNWYYLASARINPTNSSLSFGHPDIIVGTPQNFPREIQIVDDHTGL